MAFPFRPLLGKFSAEDDKKNCLNIEPSRDICETRATVSKKGITTQKSTCRMRETGNWAIAHPACWWFETGNRAEVHLACWWVVSRAETREFQRNADRMHSWNRSPVLTTIWRGIWPWPRKKASRELLSLQPCTQACICSCLLLPLQAALVVQVGQDQGGGALLKHSPPQKGLV